MCEIKPKITIVTVTYNCKDEIAKTIESVVSQDYANLEYIIIDGASTDGTVDIIKCYENKISSWKSEKDKGVYDAMNKGLRMATGSWINFMNAGDCFHSTNVISEMFSGEVRGHKVIYGNTLYFYKNGKKHLHDTAKIEIFEKILPKYQPYTHQAVFYNIEDKEIGIYNLKYHICADYDMAIRYYLKYGLKSISYKPLVVADYKAYDGISTKNQRSVIKEIAKIQWHYGLNRLEVVKSIVRFLKTFIVNTNWDE